jgi:hypothetical protein
MTWERRGHDAQMRRGRALEPHMALRNGDRREAHGVEWWEQRPNKRVECIGHNPL